MTADTEMIAPSPLLDAVQRTPSVRLTSIAFALSGAVIGATNTGVNFFLLLYYDQVLGLQPALAGLALGLALLIDGIADPLVGIVSDRWRSRLGRRHPFIIAAVLPMAMAYVAIWYPPFARDQQWHLFAYLFALTVTLRVSISLFDVPTNALIPELTADYDRRTSFAAAKTSLNWMTANLVGIVIYAVWLADPPGGPAGAGVLNGAGYRAAAVWIGGAVLLLAALVPTVLRGWIPYLSRLQPPRTSSLRALAKQVVQTYSNPSVLSLLASAIFFAAGVGLTQALWVYFLSYFWHLGADQVNAVQGAYLVAALVAWFALPRIARGRDKRALVIALSIAFWVDDVAPIALRLAHLMPANGSPALTPVLVLFGFVDGLLFNMVIAMVLSMLTDVVEDNLVRTGRREEGVVLAGQTLVTKASTALGTVLGASLLSLARFPQGAPPAELPPEVAFRLGAWFVPAMWALGLASTLAMTRYRITRAGHAQTLSLLAANGGTP